MSAFRQAKSGTSSANNNTVAATFTSPGTTQAGSLIIVGVASKTANVSSISDGTANVYVQATGALATNGTNHKTDIWYCLNAANTFTTITVTLDETNTNERTAYIMEYTSLASAAFDVAAAANDGTSSASPFDDVGASVNTNSTDGVVYGVIRTNNAITVNPKSGNEFTAGGNIDSVSIGAQCSLISSTAAAHQPVWTDTTSGVAFCASTAAFKSSSGPGSGTDSLTMGASDVVEPVSVTLSIQESG